jgi:hypothetical protein
MAARRAVEVRKESRFTPPRFNFLLGVIVLLLFPIRTSAADPTMTLLRRESQPISEGQTIIRSHYLYQPPAIAGVQLPATTVTKEIVVVGCGVNYDANRGVGQPRWMPSNGALIAAGRAGVAYESTAGPLEFSLPVSADQALVVQKNGRAVTSRFVGAAAATAIKTDDRTARYVNVFADSDLVWKVGNGYLKESLILRSRTAPTEFSFLLESPDFAFLASDASQSSFSLNEIPATAQATRVSGPMLLAPATAKQNHQILVPAPFVVDAHGKRSSLRCSVSRTASGALLYTMRIPAGFLTAPSLSYPLTVDPGFYNVPTDGVPTTYESGVTYYIESPIFYGSGQSVRVEANAFLKFAPGWTFLDFSENALVDVQGTPYNYAYFTSGYDDTVGADTDGSGLPLQEGDPSPGDYACALGVSSRLDGGVPNQCAIHYAKFAYAGGAVFVSDWDSEPPQTGGPNLLVEHSIFRDNQTGVAIATENPGVARTSNITNCLFVGGGVSFCNCDEQERSHELWLTNCTMDRACLSIAYDGPGNEFHVLRNIFKDTPYMVDRDGSFGEGGTYEIDYNGRCGTHEYEYFWTEPRDLDPDAQHNITETGNPFVANNPNGFYYLKAQSIFINAGGCTAASVGLSGKTSMAPTTRTTYTILWGQSETWTRSGNQWDAGLVNLGYHYDPVDYVVTGYVSVEGTLRVREGVRVAVSPYGILVAQDYGNLDMRGTGALPIRLSSTSACGDTTAGGLLWGGIAVVGSGARTIAYCTIENAYNGLSLQGSANPVESCRFGQCWYGIVDTAASPQSQTIRNCLFRDIVHSAICGTTSTLLSVLNCTTSRTGVGVELYPQTSATVRNCLFVGSPLAISKPPNALLSEKYNCFWNARTNFTSDTTDRSADPKFVNTTAADLYARFYLDQDLSPCLNAGNPDDKPTLTTAGYRWPDDGLADIGYHYPSPTVSWSGAISDITSLSSGEWTSFGRPWQLTTGSVLCVYSDTFWYQDSPTTAHIGSRIPLRASVDYGKSWPLFSPIDEVAPEDWDLVTSSPTRWVNRNNRTIYEFEPYLIGLSNGDLLCSFVDFTYDQVTYTGGHKSWEYTDFRVRVRRLPAACSYTSATWQEWCTVQHDKPPACTWETSSTKWSWTLWESSLLELPSDSSDVIKLICFFTRAPIKVAADQDSSPSWPAHPRDSVPLYGAWMYDYVAARVITLNKQTGTRTDIWPTTSSAPIIVSCYPDPVAYGWVQGTWPGNVTGYSDPLPRWHTGMCSAVMLYDKILAVFEENSNDNPRISSVPSIDTSGRVWNRPHPSYPYPWAYDTVYDPPISNRSPAGPNLARLSDGRLVCAFMTDEDSPETPGGPGYDSGLHADVKAVISEDWGQLWSNSVRVITQRVYNQQGQFDPANSRFASWSGLCRLRDDGLLCVFTDGPWGEFEYDRVKSTRATLSDELPIEDSLDHLNLDGAPYTWGLAGKWETVAIQDRGKILKGTRRGGFGAKAFRGDAGWTDYRVQAAMKLEADGAYAGLCVRVQSAGGSGDFGCYRCYVDHQSGGSATWGFQVLRLVQQFPAIWQWQNLGQAQSLSNFVRTNWHTLAVEARGNTFDCYLDSSHTTVTDTSNWYPSGAIGLRVTEGSASFDNVTVEPR